MGQAAQLQVADEVGGLAGGIHRNVTARVGAIGPETPDFGQIEHLATRWGNLAQEAGASFGKYRYMLNSPKLLIKILYIT